MKKLMLGNEAVARGLYEAGCKVVSSYPGTPSTEITEYSAKYGMMMLTMKPMLCLSANAPSVASAQKRIDLTNAPTAGRRWRGEGWELDMLGHSAKTM